MPPSARVRGALASLGVELNRLALSARQHVGAVEYVGEDADGRPVRARVLGRDAQDTQRLVRRWREMAYRDPPRSVPIGRLEQVEHEALAIFMAAQAGAMVPEVVTAALGPDGDAIVLTREPDVEPLEQAPSEDVSDATLTRLWEEVAKLHAAGISHGRLNLSNVVLVDGEPGLAAWLPPPSARRSRHWTSTWRSCWWPARCSSAPSAPSERPSPVSVSTPSRERSRTCSGRRSVHMCVTLPTRTRLPSSSSEATQPRRSARRSRPRLRPPRRVTLRSALTTAALAVAAYLIITQLAQIGFHQIVRELRSADVAWLALALVLAQLPYLGGAISLRGSVLTPLPLRPTVVLHSAIKFVNATVPSDAGKIAISTRFLERMGTPLPAAVVSGAVASAASTIVQVLLVVVTLPLIHVDTAKLGVGTPSTRLIVAVLLALTATGVIVLAVPKVRVKVVPVVQTALRNVREVARMRRKRLELFGGNPRRRAVLRPRPRSGVSRLRHRPHAGRACSRTPRPRRCQD